jgi:hypothetical protein
MALWLIGIALLIITTVYYYSVKRPPEDEWLLRARLRLLVRIYIGLALTAGFGISAVLTIATLNSTPTFLGVSDANRLDVLGGAFALMAASNFALQVMKHGDLVITDRGMHFFYVAIPWSAVTRLEREGSNLAVWTSGLRRSWNAWTGRTHIPIWAWDHSRETASKVVAIYREIRLDKSPDGAANQIR